MKSLRDDIIVYILIRFFGKSNQFLIQGEEDELRRSAVYQYVLFLVNNPSVKVTIHEEQRPKRRLGLLSDRFRGISDDFNDPLPEFGEYMQ